MPYILNFITIEDTLANKNKKKYCIFFRQYTFKVVRIVPSKNKGSF